MSVELGVLIKGVRELLQNALTICSTIRQELKLRNGSISKLLAKPKKVTAYLDSLATK